MSISMNVVLQAGAAILRQQAWEYYNWTLSMRICPEKDAAVKKAREEYLRVCSELDAVMSDAARTKRGQL